MATLISANGEGKYKDLKSKEDVINYILNPYKTPSQCYGCTVGEIDEIAELMLETTVKFHKEKGVQMRHFILSFHPYELNDPYIANEIAQKIIYYLGGTYETMYGVHENTEKLHIHIAINPVSYIDGSRYYGRKKEFYRFLKCICEILKSYGIYNFSYAYKKKEDDNECEE